MNKRALIAIPLVAVGIALAFVIYTLVPKQAAPPPSPQNLLGVLPASLIKQGGGIFYTDYAALRRTFSPSATTSATAVNDLLVQFGQQSGPYDMGSSLFRLFWLPDLAKKLNLDWQTLEEVAWSPLVPLEEARAPYDWTALTQELLNEGYKAKAVGTATLYDVAPTMESDLATMGQVAISSPYLVMEHFSPLTDYPLHREDILKGIDKQVDLLIASPQWAAFSPALKGAPSFFLGPAPVAPGVEPLVALDPNGQESNLAERTLARSKLLLGPYFLDWCVYPDLAQPNRLTFLLRYQDDSAALADKEKIEPAMAASYSAVFNGQTFLDLLGKPEVSVEGNLLKIVVKSQTGVKMVQAMVQGSDFGFLYKSEAE